MVVPGVRREVDDDLVPLPRRVPEVGDPTGTGISPASVAMMGSFAPFDSDQLKDRAVEAFRMRKRYLRLATFISGHGVPLTVITSP